IPSRKRPPDASATVLAAAAIVIGSRAQIFAIPVAMISRFVCASSWAACANGSRPNPLGNPERVVAELLNLLGELDRLRRGHRIEDKPHTYGSDIHLLHFASNGLGSTRKIGSARESPSRRKR